MRILLSILLSGLLVGCVSSTTPPPAALSAGIAIGSAITNIQNAKAATTQAAAHSDDVGRALLANVQPILNDAVVGIKALVVQVNLLIDASAVKDKQILDANNRADSREQAALLLIKIVSIVLCIGGIGLTVYCRSATLVLGFMAPLGKAASAAGAAGAGIATGFCFIGQVQQRITPFFVREMEWLLSGVGVLLFAALIYELVIHRKTIFQTAHDTAAEVQPTVPYPPSVSNLLQKIAPDSLPAKTV